MINEEFIASLDNLVATCLWPSIVDERSQGQYYRQRVSFYKHFDGRDGKPNWRTDLYNCLTEWQARFPQVVRNRKSMLDHDPLTQAAGDGQGAELIPRKWLLGT